MTGIDRPSNCYTEGGQYLGMFLLSPGSIRLMNSPPRSISRMWMMIVGNRFMDNGGIRDNDDE